MPKGFYESKRDWNIYNEPEPEDYTKKILGSALVFFVAYASFEFVKYEYNAAAENDPFLVPVEATEVLEPEQSSS